jgi:hypothetical protein
VEFHFGELFPRVGFIVTNLETPSRSVVRFYNKRGTAEQWIKEGKQAVKDDEAELSSFPLQPSAARPEPAGLQLGQLWRRLALPKRIENWSLMSLLQRLVKTGGRLVKHARYYWLLLAESPSDETIVWQYAPADSRSVASGGVAEVVAGGESIQSQEGMEGCLTKSDGKVATSSLGLALAQSGTCPKPWARPRKIIMRRSS